MSLIIHGEKGGKGGGGGGRVAKEDPNTLQSHAVAKILDLMCEGEIAGLVDGAKSIFLDGTPLQNEDGEYNFDGIEWVSREGLPNQQPVKGHGTVATQVIVNTLVKNSDPIIRTVTNPEADGFRVTIRLNALTKQDTSNGDLKGSEVQYAIDVRYPNSNWREYRKDTIKGKTTSVYQESVRVDLEGSGPWDVRVRRITEDHEDDASYNDDMSWDYLSTLVDGKFSYPDCAYIGLRVDSKLFGNSIPSRAYLIKGLIVRVPSNYDPVKRTYSGLWNGTFKRAWTDNPAWLFYDIALNDRYGAGLGTVDKWALYQIGKYCDVMVPDGYGGQHPRFTLNTVINSRKDALSVLNTLASNFRSMLYWGSDTIVPVQDAPATGTSRDFTGSNQVTDSLKYTESRLSTRHTVAFVTWNNPELNYEQDLEVVEDKDSILNYGWNKVDIVAYGCTNRGQARRYGLWTLAVERLLRETAEFTVGSDSADLRPGDVVRVADKNYQGARLGGRLTRDDHTTTVVTLDKYPTDTDFGRTTTLSLRLPNGTIEHRNVKSHKGDEVTVTEPFSQTPAPMAIWVLSGDEVSPRSFRVQNIQEDGKGKYTITALEHVPGIYDLVEKGLQLPDTPYTTLPTGNLVAPLNISVETYTYLAGGKEHQGLTVSWTVADDPRVQQYVLQYISPDNPSWQDAGTTSTLSMDVKDVVYGEWQFRVASLDALGRRSSWAVRVTTIASLLDPVLPDSVNVEVATFSITLVPVLSGGREQLFNFYRSSTPLTEDLVTSNAVYLGKSNTLVDAGLNSATQYYYYIQGVNPYGVTAKFYPVQAQTGSNFDDIFQAITDDIEREGSIYDATVNGLKPAAVEAAEQAVVPFRDQLDKNTQAIGEFQFFDEEQTIKMLLLKSAGEATNSSLRVEQTVRANIARQVTTLEVDQAKVMDDLYAMWDPETGFKSAAIRTVQVGDNRAILGMQADGQNAEIAAIADRFYVVNEVSGEAVTAFVAENGKVYMPESFIRTLQATKIVTPDGGTLIEDGYIRTELLDVDSIKANELVSSVNGFNGRPTFAFRSNGTYEFNSPGSGGGTRFDGRTQFVYNDSGRLVVEIGYLS